MCRDHHPDIMVTLTKLNAALGLTLKELDHHGFLTDKVSRTDVFLCPLSWAPARGFRRNLHAIPEA